MLATENPIEQEGTFPLPEAQLDRFFLRTALGYPAEDDEVAIVEQQLQRTRSSALRPVLSLDGRARAARRRPGRLHRSRRPPLGDPARARDARGGRRRDRRIRAWEPRARARGARVGAPRRARVRDAGRRRGALPLGRHAPHRLHAELRRRRARDRLARSGRSLPRAVPRARAAARAPSSSRRRPTPRSRSDGDLPAHPAPAGARASVRRAAQHPPRSRLGRRRLAAVPAGRRRRQDRLERLGAALARARHGGVRRPRALRGRGAARGLLCDRRPSMSCFRGLAVAEQTGGDPAGRTLIGGSAIAARGLLGYFDEADGSVLASAAELARVGAPDLERTFDAPEDTLERGLGHLAEQRRDLPGGHVRLRPLRLPRSGRPATSGSTRSSGASRSSRSSSRIPSGSRASRTSAASSCPSRRRDGGASSLSALTEREARERREENERRWDGAPPRAAGARHGSRGRLFARPP